MELQHIWAVTLRHIRLWKREPNLIIFFFYWPLLDILIWGFLGAWIQKMQQTSANYEIVFLFCILLWQTTVRSAITLTYGFLEEIWSYNLINLFSLPIRIIEWVSGNILFVLLIALANGFYSMALIKYFYGISIMYLLKIFFIFAPPLILSGLWLGFTILFFVVNFGKRASEMGWVISWFFSPLCGAFYPVSLFPAWIQKISYCIPMTYIFDGLRSYILNNQSPTQSLMTAYLLSITYLIISFFIFLFLFDRTKQKGLARLTD